MTLDFDGSSAPCNFTSGSPPGSTYAASLGVTFSGSAEVLDACSSFGVSGFSAPNHLAWNSSAFISSSVTMTFSTALQSFSIGTASSSGGSVTGYDASGAVLDVASRSVSSTMSQTSVSGTGIVEVVVSATAYAGVYDDLSWTVLRDDDGDGYTIDVDCDDADPAVNPGATESCNLVDDDCDGTVDESDAIDAGTWFADADADGYGDAAVSDVACTQPSGTVADATDCDDADATVNPGATESCNLVDDDCDGTVDESDAIDASLWFGDADADGYGDAAVWAVACTQPSGTVADATDCDDADATVNPGATEVPYDAIDQDCDGSDLCDADADGFDAPECDGTDCDDDDDTVNPDAEDTWYDGVDSDCDEWSDYDADGDGFDSESYGGDDCDDALDDVYPGAPDAPYDGVIHDCDDADEYDADGDGFDAADHGGEDCDDANSDIRPDATETWYDGIDDDCDGNDDDQDGDGVGVAEDCDDTDPTVLVDCGSAEDDDTADPLDPEEEGGGKGASCAAAAGPSALWFAGLLPLAWLRRRRA